jgi:FG-GAP-like repeat/FG-GAP repeat
VILNISYDASVNSAPAGFRTGVGAVAQYLQNNFTDPVTVNISVGYGEVNGQSLGGALGESLTFLNSYAYSALRNALAADAKTADDSSAVASLPATAPVAGTFWVARAEAKALGLIGASASTDGFVGFSNTVAFDYDNSNGVSPGQYDFYGVVAHEITEVLGRVLLAGGTVGRTANSYEPLDLFHYAAAGVRTFSGTQAGYFSLDAGQTNLDNFNTNGNGDFGDWAGSAAPDAMLAFGASGVVEPITPTDLRVMDVLGWDRAAAIPPPPPPPPPPPTPTGPSVAQPVAPIDGGFYADLGGDHRADIVQHSTSGLVALWQMNGTAVQSAQTFGSIGQEWHIESTADFNGDGKADVLWRATNGAVSIWQMNGAQIQAAPVIGAVGNEWHVAGTGDFDGDGMADIAWRSDAGAMMLWRMSGTQIASAQIIGSVGNEWHVVGIGDFNGDGKADLLWRNDNGTVIEFQMNGMQIAAAPTVGALGREWHVEGLGDFNGDGLTDILWRNDAGALLEFQMNGAQIQSASAAGSLGNDWHVYGAGDFGGDGKTDILWRNDNGTLLAWEMNGASVANAQTVAPLGLDWTLGVHHYDFV